MASTTEQAPAIQLRHSRLPVLYVTALVLRLLGVSVSSHAHAASAITLEEVALAIYPIQIIIDLLLRASAS